MKERIIELRKALKLTQTEFGEALGASRSMIASYEGGAVVPPQTIIELICTKFHVSKEWLVDGTGDMHDFPLEDDTPGKLVSKYMTSPDRVKKLMRELVALDDSWYQKLDEILKNISEE